MRQHEMIKMPRIWEILKEFKNLCEGHGWKASENQDWIQVNHCYHNFLWARDVHLSSFKKIASSRKCVVCEGLSYRVVEASCVAWLFSEKPSEALFRTVFENPDLSSKVALYDLSPLLDGESRCTKLNNTDSPVFQEFENFLENGLGVKLHSPSEPGVNPGTHTITELA